MAATRERAGRPTQVHGVTTEERAYDASGQRLPWGYRWPDDHPNARFQKPQPEEKGAFGKSSRRLGSLRATRTQTPAKKENPTLDGFEAALKYEATSKDKNDEKASGPQTSSETTQQPLTSVVKEPLQVMLYGFSSDFQWAAIDFYERVSGGMVCEDYPREPPAEKRRYRSGLSGGSIPRRALTSSELTLSSQYHGGSCWIVVTFESHESGERAITSSPHLIQGHWVYAEPYRGISPPDDSPIPGKEEDRQAGLLGPPRPPSKSATLGPSIGSALRRESSSTQRQTVTLPRSFLTPAGQTFQDVPENQSISSTTASSATALAAEPIYPSLRQRNPSSSPSTLSPDRTSGGDSTALVPHTPASKATFTHFPDVPRTVVKPASEALLPQPTWWESVVKSLTRNGLIPGDMIGSTVPRREDGSFDWDRSSVYWKMWFWLDQVLGTDLCGIRGD
ncbi:hypothetical protein MMC10_006457 [Thelotrema lepadinum]|nr:hypothetical protein [Thelotrema lepadinum]